MKFYKMKNMFGQRFVVSSINIYFILLGIYPASGDDSPDLRIVGGRLARITDRPYIVLIRFYVNIQLSSSCTGSIIAEEWILSAAQCFYNSEVSMIKIMAGISTTRKISNTTVTRDPLEIIIHPSYIEGEMLECDLALLRVEKYELTASVGILQLGGEEWPQDKKRMYARSCQAAGWGSSSTGSSRPSVTLIVITVKAEHGEKSCLKCFSRDKKKLGVCWKGGYRGICLGDSGGPLVCDGKGYGVAHMAVNNKLCDKNSPPKRVGCGETSTVSLYTYTCPELDWINRYASNQPRRPKSCKASLLNVMAIGLFLTFLITFCLP